jgi:hypothetical protein
MEDVGNHLLVSLACDGERRRDVVLERQQVVEAATDSVFLLVAYGFLALLRVRLVDLLVECVQVVVVGLIAVGLEHLGDR